MLTGGVATGEPEIILENMNISDKRIKLSISDKAQICGALLLAGSPTEEKKNA